MLTRRVVRMAGAMMAVVSSPSAVQAAVPTEVHCNATTHVCQVVAHSPGKSGGNHTSARTAAPAPQATTPKTRSARRTSASVSSSGSPAVGAGGPGRLSSPSGRLVQLTPAQRTTGVAAFAVCGGVNVVDPSVCLGGPAPGRGAAAPAASKVAGKANPKAPAQPPPTVAELAAAAVATLKLPNPEIGSAPCTGPDCMGAVGVPVWLWTQPWTPKTTTAAIRGTRITATAKMTKVTWAMGDGATVTCNDAGTPYQDVYGFKKSPDCGYLYTKTSANEPGMRYPLTATATWIVTWTGDEVGATTTTTLATVRVMIGEYQVLSQ